MSDNIIISTLKYIAVEILWDIVYFPIWWYSKGLNRMIRYCLNSASLHWHRRLALGIWLKSMFKPMYGDYTKDGRIISFGMRIIVLIWKLIMMVVWYVLLLVFFIAWTVLPLLVIYFLLYQVFNIPFIFFEL